MTAATERLRGYWAARTPRERRMLAALGVVVGAILFWYGVVTPLVGWSQAGARREAAAALRLAEVRALAAEVERLGGAWPAAAPADVEAALLAAAAEAGVTLDGLRREDGVVSTTAVAPSTAALFAWLRAAESELGLSAREVSAVRGEAGGVEAELIFE